MKLKLLFPALLSLFIFAAGASAAEIYVDAGSNSTVQEGTKENPYKTIQAAADIVNPGDTVLVAPGIYYESVTLTRTGTKEEPIVFRALDTGENKTIISLADRGIREKAVKWEVENAEIGLYSIPWNEEVTAVLSNGAMVLKYKTLYELENFLGINGAQSVPGNTINNVHRGFFYDNSAKKLYIRLEEGEYGSADPNKNLMCVSPKFYNSITIDGVDYAGYRSAGIAENSYCFGITPEASANVVVYGFTFETPGWCGVYIRGNDVRISNCWFRGCMSGIIGGQRHMYDTYLSDNVVVEYCDWNLWPYYEESVALGDMPRHENNYYYFWWTGKSGMFSVHDYEAGCFVARIGRHWKIRNNYIFSCQDGLSYAFMTGAHKFSPEYNTNLLVNHGGDVEIYENRFEHNLDNCIETEDKGDNVDIHHNEFVNNFAPISWQPLGGKPWPTNIKVHHNVFYNDPDMAANWRYNMGYRLPWLKLGANISQWQRGPMTKEEVIGGSYPAKPLYLNDKGLQVYNNSVYWPDGWYAEYVGAMTNYTQSTNNIQVRNNLFYGMFQIDQVVERTFIPSGRGIPGDGGHSVRKSDNAQIPTNLEKDKIVIRNEDTSSGIAYETIEDAGVYMDGIVLYLKEDSPLRGTGTVIEGERLETTDIGAMPYGSEKWHINYSPYPYGDVDCDNIIDSTDLMLIAEKAGVSEVSAEYNTRCDLNFDGLINESDVEIFASII